MTGAIPNANSMMSLIGKDVFDRAATEDGHSQMLHCSVIPVFASVCNHATNVTFLMYTLSFTITYR